MNVKTVVPLAVAVVLGSVSAIVARRMITSNPPVTADGLPATAITTDVLVAAHDLTPGQKLGEGDFKVVKMATTSDGLTDLIYKRDDAFKLNGRVARMNVMRGQPMIDAMLAPQGSQAGLQGVIRPGMRAITITCDEGIAPFLDPGNRVDIVGKLPGENGQGQLSMTIVQGVEVIAVGNRLSSERPEPKKPTDGGEAAPVTPSKAVTLLVTPEQAERIDLAGSQGQTRVVMRSPTDTAMIATRGASTAGLGAVTASAQLTPSTQPTEGSGVFDTQSFPPRQANPQHEMIVIRGGVVQKVEVDVAPTPKTNAKAPKADPAALSGTNNESGN